MMVVSPVVTKIDLSGLGLDVSGREALAFDNVLGEFHVYYGGDEGAEVNINVTGVVPVGAMVVIMQQLVNSLLPDQVGKLALILLLMNELEIGGGAGE